MRKLYPAPRCWFCCSLPGRGGGEGSGQGKGHQRGIGRDQKCPQNGGFLCSCIVMHEHKKLLLDAIVGSHVFIACSTEPKYSSRQYMGDVVVAVWGICAIFRV